MGGGVDPGIEGGLGAGIVRAGREVLAAGDGDAAIRHPHPGAAPEGVGVGEAGAQGEIRRHPGRGAIERGVERERRDAVASPVVVDQAQESLLLAINREVIDVAVVQCVRRRLCGDGPRQGAQQHQECAERPSEFVFHTSSQGPPHLTLGPGPNPNDRDIPYSQ